MKKLICVSCTLIICILFCSCGGTKSITEEDLTENDYKYIDAVYNAMSTWDTTHYDSGENHYINKISFQDFDGTNKISFYKNYPIGGYCGSGYYINDDGLEFIDPDIYDNDTTTRHRGCLMQTVLNGIDWDYTSTDEEKYETIKEAYIYFLQNNIYKD